MRLHGQPPTADEQEAYCERLNAITAAGGRIKLVQIHTVARVPAESWVASLAMNRSTPWRSWSAAARASPWPGSTAAAADVRPPGRSHSGRVRLSVPCSSCPSPTRFSPPSITVQQLAKHRGEVQGRASVRHLHATLARQRLKDHKHIRRSVPIALCQGCVFFSVVRTASRPMTRRSPFPPKPVKPGRLGGRVGNAHSTGLRARGQPCFQPGLLAS